MVICCDQDVGRSDSRANRVRLTLDEGAKKSSGSTVAAAFSPQRCRRLGASGKVLSI
jgi:hypothetical protein